MTSKEDMLLTPEGAESVLYASQNLSLAALYYSLAPAIATFRGLLNSTMASSEDPLVIAGLVLELLLRASFGSQRTRL